MEESGNRLDRPEHKLDDLVHSLVKIGLSAMPIVGGPAAEIFSSIILAPLSKRRDQWIESIADGLKALEERMDNFHIAELSKNEAFVTALMQATQAAIRTHQMEKREALRNAVLNTALGSEPEEDFQLIFLNHIDILTAWHLRILNLLDDPQRWCVQHGVPGPTLVLSDSAVGAIANAFPDLAAQRDFCEQIVNDLKTRGFIQEEIGWIGGPYTTPIGKRFLAFITSPP